MGVAAVALIISILAMVTSTVVALWVHHQVGSRVRCDWRTAIPIHTPGPAVRYVSVNAMNRGRAPTTIQGWGFVFVNWLGRPTDKTIVMLRHDPSQPKCPFRLESESSVFWAMPYSDLASSVGTGKVKPFVRTGADKMIVGRKTISRTQLS